MTLGQKLILYALAVALLPLAATGFSLVQVGETALRQRIAEAQQANAIAVAAKVSQAVEEVARRLASVMEMTDPLALSKPERVGLLRVLYRSSPDVSAVLLIDDGGDDLAAPVFLGMSEGPELGDHPPAQLADVERLRRQILDVRRAGLSRGALLMSPVYYPDTTAARVAVAVPCCFDRTGNPRAAAGVELVLRQDVLKLAGIDIGKDAVIFVADTAGSAILHPKRPVGENLRSHGSVAAFLDKRSRGVTRYSTPAGPVLAAFAPVGNLGWGVVVEQPESVAFAAAAKMRRQTLIWIVGTTLVVLVSGLLFAGRVRRLLTRMVEGAGELGRGNLAYRIPIQRSDEIGELADTMNSMAGALASSYKELETWNQTLEQKVDERTRELKDAQSQLLTQSKLAAIGQLGAGVAHEVNNPLTGILGYAQILLAKKQEGDPDRKSLEKIEAAAKRCKGIVDNLLRFSERGLQGREKLVANDLVREVTGMIGPGDAKAELVLDLDATAPAVIADPGQISIVLINILTNAKASIAAERGVITVRTRPKGEGVAISITDTGVGIAAEHLPRIFDPFFTTKSVWEGVGLGLSVAYRIISDHGGLIDVESEVGKGSTFTVWLPQKPKPLIDAQPAASLRQAVTLK